MKRKRLILAALSLLLLLVLPLSAVLAGEKEETGQLMEDVGTIIRKSMDTVHIWETDFEVTPGTEIRTKSGTWISLDQMLVPCRVRIKYNCRPGGEMPIATEIDILEEQKPR